MSTRPELGSDELDQLADAYKQVQAMGPGPEKDRMLTAVRNVHAQMLEHYDMPTEAIAPDAHMLGIVDWGSGLARTGAGEGALAAKAAYDKATTGETKWDLGSAANRIANAAIPVGEPATSSGQYLDMLGVPEGGMLSDTALGKKMGVERMGRWDITPRGAAGFALDMGLTPKALMRGAAPAAAMTAGKTAAELAAENAAAGAERKLAPPPTVPQQTLQGGKAILSGALTDPLKQLGELLYKRRFGAADEAAEATGKKLPSTIMMENGMPGVTSGGIKKGMKSIINREENAIDQLHTPESAGMMPVRNRSEFLTPLNSADTQKALKIPGSSIAVEGAVNDVTNQFEHAAMQDEALMGNWQKSKMEAGKVRTDPNTGELLFERRGEGRMDAPLSVNPPATKSVLQHAEQQFGPSDARQIRRNFQSQARDAGWYSKRDVLEPGAKAASDAKAAMYNKVGGRAGELELEMLDEAKPGLGGEVYGKHQNISGLMEGAPYLDREFTGGGPTRATTGGARAISPWGTMTKDLVSGAMGVAEAGGGKVLMNPWTRYLAAPAARSAWINDYYRRQTELSDSNPYALIRKYGVQK